MVMTRSQSARAADAGAPSGAPAAQSASPQPPQDGGEEAPAFRYLTAPGVRRILEYKYSGSDASLLYNYVISPLAQWLVDHVVPPRVAPNTITISGLGLVVLSHLVLLW